MPLCVEKKTLRLRVFTRVFIPLHHEGVGERMCRSRGAVYFACAPQAPLVLIASHGVTEVEHLRCVWVSCKKKPLRGRLGETSVDSV